MTNNAPFLSPFAFDRPGARARRLAILGCVAFALILFVASAIIGSIALDQLLAWDPWTPRPQLIRLHRPPRPMCLVP